ncbi:hypothetical protein CHUAL_001181 [Chamberlinius hualienensis]
MQNMKISWLQFSVLWLTTGFYSAEDKVSMKTKYNVLLLTSTYGAKSHSIYLTGIVKKLVFHGHQVTFRSIGQVEPIPGVKNSVFEFPLNSEYYNGLFFQVKGYLDFYNWLNRLCTHISEMISYTYNDPFIANLMINNFTSEFDIALIDVHAYEFYLPLVNHLRIPVILISTYTLQAPHAIKVHAPDHFFNNVFGFPNSSPNRFSAFTDNLLSTFWSSFILVKEMNQLFPVIVPGVPSLDEMFKGVSMLMSANFYSTQDAIPSTSNTLNIGCTQCHKAQNLPDSLGRALNDSSEHGAIYFSMGSIITSDQMPVEFLRKVVNVLSRLNQTIIWKGQINIDDIGSVNLTNFHFKDWIPQQDLLGHPKILLIITHGGLGTFQEASYHGCPILGFPLTLDHNYNIYHAEKNGYAEKINWMDFKENQLLTTINKIIYNPRYKERAMLASRRMRDVLLSPAEEAVFWTEYVIRHKGAYFLRNEAHHLHWYQYFLCDVIGVLAAIATLLITFTWLTLRAALARVKKLM